MAANTSIEWADHTCNPWTGCTAVSPACDHCYAEAWAKRAGRDFASRKRTKTWGNPKRWNDHHQEFFAAHGRRQRVFCASLADVFDNQVDPQWRIDLLELIAACPNLDWLLLTKRIGNAERLLDEALGVMSHGVTRWRDMPWPNVWIGATVCNQVEADRDIPKLLDIPAAKRFLSMEPLLGPVDLTALGSGLFKHNALRRLQGNFNGFGTGGSPIDWVICGGESGPGARPMHPDWVRSLRDQCATAYVPFLFKQWGEWGPTWNEAHAHLGLCAPMDPAGMRKSIAGTRVIVGRRTNGDVVEAIWPIVRHGKKAAGRLLDGCTHDGFPDP